MLGYPHVSLPPYLPQAHIVETRSTEFERRLVQADCGNIDLRPCLYNVDSKNSYAAVRPEE